VARHVVSVKNRNSNSKTILRQKLVTHRKSIKPKESGVLTMTNPHRVKKEQLNKSQIDQLKKLRIGLGDFEAMLTALNPRHKMTPADLIKVLDRMITEDFKQEAAFLGLNPSEYVRSIVTNFLPELEKPKSLTDEQHEVQLNALLQPAKREIVDRQLTLDDLQVLPFFRDVEERLLKKLRDNSRFVECDDNFQLVAEGEIFPLLIIVYSGVAGVQRTTGKNKIIPIIPLTAGDPIGEINLIDGLPHNADVFAVKNLVGIEIDPVVFLTCLSQSRYLYRNLAQCLAKKIHSNNEQAYHTLQEDKYSYFLVAIAIEKMISVFGYRPDTSILSQTIMPEEIGNWAGILPNTVSNIISRMKKEKIIKYENDTLEILNWKKLKKAADTLSLETRSRT